MTNQCWPLRYARNVRIVEAFANGQRLQDIADDEGINRFTVLQVLRGAGIDTSVNARHSNRSKRSRIRRRDIEIAKARALGKDLAALAKCYRLSQQRIGQIIAREKRSETAKVEGEKR